MSTAPEHPHASLALYLITVLLLSVASIAALAVVYEHDNPLTIVWGGIISVAVAVGLGAITLPWYSLSQPPRWTLLLVALLSLQPLILPQMLEYFPTWADANQHHPLEIQLLLCLHWLGWSLVGLGRWVQCLHAASAVSLFLMLGAIAMAQDAPRVWPLAAYGGVGAIWMGFNHRYNWQVGLPSIAKVVRYRASSLKQLPWRTFGISFGVLAVVFGVIWLLGYRAVDWDLIGWLASSGGNWEPRQGARWGLGDGPDEVAGTNARTAGLVDSDHMIEDCRDSLIDVISETYGEPLKLRDHYEKMLSGDAVQVIQRRGHVPQNQTPNRDFTLRRKKRTEPTQSPDVRGPRALFEVQGRTPLHIRRVVYDIYDGQTHTWRESRNVSPSVLEPSGGYWLEIRRPLGAGAWYAADDTHTIKITSLADNFVPAPPLLKALQLRHASYAECFHWQQDDVLALRERSRWPSGVVFKTRARTVSYDSIPAPAWKVELAVVRASRYGQIPAHCATALCELAQEWCRNLPPGWPQVQAIVTRLRNDYQLDPEAVVPADHPEPIWWFLTESQRGPDYFFASSAVLLLRSLGYPARLCLGYYAAPEAYDPQTDHTPVRSHDLHFWAEVRLRDGLWVVIEPTPGYDTLPAKLPWWSMLKSYVFGSWVALVHAWPWWITGMLGLGLAWAVRRHMMEAVLFSAWWFIAKGGSWRRVVRTTWRILEWRAKRAGIIRPAWQTPTSWLADWQQDFALTPQQQRAFVAYLAMALYAPQAAPSDSIAEILRTSRAWLQVATYLRWCALRQTKKVVHPHAVPTC